jgi:chromate reductase, NAD(P)H dehydrogenase (quinone)
MEADPPGQVVEFEQKLREAEAILLACPEYDYSVSALLKNAID